MLFFNSIWNEFYSMHSYPPETHKQRTDVTFSPQRMDDSTDDAKQKGDGSRSTMSDYEDASEDFPIPHDTARKLLELTSIYKIRKSQAKSNLDD
ncbi:hypothetical protein Y032_0040g257 [Ancylostoma ceylanicum]|uniref:Uncharacterized protein n=1 Tax=Ancylostoma ceylanicum TaxID=53326 RepID=A0A016UHB7_9BILA|nr:hypothetical protein Y032_0040g257 [Ancylostoma ceylanicum]